MKKKIYKILHQNNPNKDKNSPNGLHGYERYDSWAWSINLMVIKKG